MGYIATGLLLPMMVLTVVDVFLRFAFNSPIIGTTEVTMLIMVCLPLSVAWSGISGRHVKIDLVMTHFQPRVQHIVGVVTTFLGLLAFAFIGWRSFMISLFELEHGYFASVLVRWPVHPFHWVLVLSCAMFCVVLLTQLIQEVKGAIKP